MVVAPDPVTGVRFLYAIDGKEVYTIDIARMGLTPTTMARWAPPPTPEVWPLIQRSRGSRIRHDLPGNQLVKVSLFNRTRSLSVFQIYISQSDSSGEIVSYAGGGAPYNAPPKGGFTITDTQTGGLINIVGPAQGGDALIGAEIA